MKNKYRKISFFILIILSITLCGCIKKKDRAGDSQKLNVYVDVKDTHSLNILKYIIDEYKNENSKVTVNINNVIGNDISQDADKGELGDIIFTNRNHMIELQKKGLLNEMSSYYDKNEIDKNYYKIIGSYGIYNNKYYGIGIVPYTVNIFYNKNLLKQMNVTEPKNILEIIKITKKLDSKNQKIPVILTDDVDIYGLISSLIVRNKITSYNLDNIYDKSKEFYQSKTEFQQIFDTLNKLNKKGKLKKDIFEVGNENSIKKFVNDGYPIIISTSYYNNKFKDKDNIGIVEDYSILNSEKSNLPIIVNSLVCVPINSSNKENVEEFIKFIYSKKLQEKLWQNGFITANKEQNKKNTGIQKNMINDLKKSDDKSVMFIYNIPEELNISINSKIEKVLNGEYNGHEWEEIMDKYFLEK